MRGGALRTTFGAERGRPAAKDGAAGLEVVMSQSDLSKKMRLLAQHDLAGFGNCGEGMVIQLARDGRRVLWLAHESAPKNITAVDVTDPRKPTVIVQTDLPHREMRSNSLDLVGIRSGPRRSRTTSRRRRPDRERARSRSTTCSSTSAASSTPSTVSPAGSTCSSWRCEER